MPVAIVWFESASEGVKVGFLLRDNTVLFANGPVEVPLELNFWALHQVVYAVTTNSVVDNACLTMNIVGLTAKEHAKRKIYEQDSKRPSDWEGRDYTIPSGTMQALNRDQ